MDVSGKVVLLTGGSAGIGREMAWQLKARGAVVVITGRNEERLEAMRKDGFLAISADLSSAEGVDALVAAWGGRELDILVNNAGMLIDHDFREKAPDPAEADAGIYTNLNAPIRLTVAMMPVLTRRPEAAIVMVTSGLAIAPTSRQPVYCATKAGLRSYTMALREQLKGHPIHVIEALPPVVDTAMNAGNKMKKMAPQECARHIIEAIENDRDEAMIGDVRTLRRVEGFSPSLARKLMIRF